MIEIVRDHFLSAIVCCDINPSREDCFDELDRQLGSIYNGTSGGWKALRPDDETFIEGNRLWDDSKPIPCKDLPGRWHYVVIT